MRYKGLARVTQRRARKGFNLKYNPDSHWSSAFYKTLDFLQTKDGCDILNFGRDDQAGFRLDTMATHRLHSTLSVKDKECVTTYTDYTNKYPATLQTTSYNFVATETTGEICCGVVKAPGIHKKGAAQHFADLQMLEQKEVSRPAFINPATNMPKHIECVRVDGGFDEGPPHQEVQYWWTRRHIEAETVVTMITSRNSGASYRNRVELQNGCLALGHSNLFIPSTLNCSCLTQSGRVDEGKLRENLESAIDVYIARVDGTPCASTEIHLFKGEDSTEYQKENELLKIYVKGSKSAKAKLEKEHSVMYDKFKATLDIRDRHIRKHFPIKYAFILRCCYQDECSHPICAQGKMEEITWYRGGPSIDYLPLPIPDPEHPFNGTGCNKCSGSCSGHYIDVSDVLQIFDERGHLPPCAQPPSTVLLDTYKKYKCVPPDAVVQEMSEATLLPLEETRMWFNHLHAISENRKAGAKKAAEKRRANTKTNRANAQDKDIDGLCCECGSEDPPGDKDNVVWLSCDGCLKWFHVNCLGLDIGIEAARNLDWCCLSCNERW